MIHWVELKGSARKKTNFLPKVHYKQQQQQRTWYRMLIFHEDHPANEATSNGPAIYVPSF